MRHLTINQTSGEYALNFQEVGDYLEGMVIASEQTHCNDGCGNRRKGTRFTLQLWHSREHSEMEREEVDFILVQPAAIMALLRILNDGKIHRFRTHHFSYKPAAGGKTRSWWASGIDGVIPGHGRVTIPNN